MIKNELAWQPTLLGERGFLAAIEIRQMAAEIGDALDEALFAYELEADLAEALDEAMLGEHLSQTPILVGELRHALAA